MTSLKYDKPKIDMLISTEDDELATLLLDLNIADVSITPLVKQDAYTMQDIVVVINYATALLGAIKLLLEIIKAHKDKKPNKTKTVIYGREHITEIQEIVVKYKESVEIEIRDED